MIAVALIFILLGENEKKGFDPESTVPILGTVENDGR